MNKKGFTLLEIILSIIIFGVIIAIAYPNIESKINSSKIKSAATIEKMLLKNLELYNKEKEKDIWCFDNYNNTGCQTAGIKEVTIDELLTVNSNIDLGECLINKDNGLKIRKDVGEEYSYSANIICSKDFKNNTSHVATNSDLENKNIYYKSEE